MVIITQHRHIFVGRGLLIWFKFVSVCLFNIYLKTYLTNNLDFSGVVVVVVVVIPRKRSDFKKLCPKFWVNDTSWKLVKQLNGER